MKNKRIHRNIPALMIISQIFLTGFVVYWLFTQYQQEKKGLQQELLQQYIDSQEQVLDSTIFHKIVSPILDTAVVRYVPKNKELIKISIEDTFLQADSYTKIICSDSLFTENLFATAKQTSPLIHTIKVDPTVENIDEDIILRGIRMIVEKSKNMDNGNSNPRVLPYVNNLDSNLFKSIFSERLNNNNWPFKLVWQKNDTIANGKAQLRKFYFKGGIGNLPGVSVEKYGYHLFQQILPQILFAIFLMGLSISALLFSWRSLKKQMELNKLRSSFISNISHELKTPVSTVKVALEALKTYDMKQNPKLVTEYMDIAGMEVDRLENLIGKVLKHNILEEKSGLIEKIPTNITELIHQVIHSLKPQINKTNSSVNFNIEKEIILPIDLAYAEGVIINLLDNAIKYAGNAPVINIVVHENHDYVFITVDDNGPGIEEKYITKLFDKFFRIPNGDKHNIKGYGLGLSFVDLVMKQHGGSVQVKNNAEGGCSFTLSFPKS